MIVIGSTNYVNDEGMQALRWRDGIYVCIRGG